MSDLINRQAAIDALRKLSRESGYIDLPHEYVTDAVRTLPSAQPETHEKRTETHACDCISRQAAIDALHMHLMYRMGTDSNKKRLDDWINNLPSAQPDRSLWFRIGEVCVGESKGDISAEMAVEKIRELLREAERRKE